MPEAYWAAIATLLVMQSTLGATLMISIERIAATAVGAFSWRAGGQLLRRKSNCVRDCDCSHWVVVDLVSPGEGGISLREHHPRDYRFDSAFESGVGDRAAQVPRSLNRDHRRSRGRAGLAGT